MKMKVISLKKKALARVAVATLSLLLTIFIGRGVSAITVESSITQTGSTDLVLDISSVLQVTIPSQFIKLDLTPGVTGTTFTSSDFNIVAATNNPEGYSISVSAASTDLSKSIGNATDGFSAITIPTLGDGFFDEETFSTNHWGYKTSNDSGFKAFETNIDLGGSETAVVADQTDLTFGAKVDITQPAGIYTLSLNFLAVANITTDFYSMQDFTDGVCAAQASNSPFTVMDERDFNTYTVRYINGNCWMTENLNFAITDGTTLTPETSNVTEDRTIATVYDLSTKDDGVENSYTLPEVKAGNNKQTGWWYNFCAATAGTFCEGTGTSGSGPSTEDICPAGWALPTYDQIMSLTPAGYNKYDKTYVSAFTPFAAGSYSTSTLYNSGSSGGYWSSSADSATNRYNLNYATSSGLRSGANYRSGGFSVRCVRAK